MNEHYEKILAGHNKRQDTPTNTCSFVPGASIVCLGFVNKEISSLEGHKDRLAQAGLEFNLASARASNNYSLSNDLVPLAAPNTISSSSQLGV